MLQKWLCCRPVSWISSCVQIGSTPASFLPAEVILQAIRYWFVLISLWSYSEIRHSTLIDFSIADMDSP